MDEMERFTLTLFGSLAAICVVAALAALTGLSWLIIACSGALFLITMGYPLWVAYKSALKDSAQLEAILSQLPDDVQGEAYKVIVDLESRVMDLTPEFLDAALQPFAEFDGFDDFKELLLERLGELYEFRFRASGMPLHGVHDIR